MLVINQAIQEQGSEMWLEFRKGKIGGSDAAVVMQLSPYKTPHDLWMEKKGLKTGPQMNDAMRLGNILEPVARETYEHIYNESMTPQVHAHDDNPKIIASLDGINLAGDKILEIKCGKKAYAMAKMGEVDITYIYQCQHNMMVTGAEKCDFFAYDPEELQDPILIPIHKDNKLIEELYAKELEFIEALDSDVPPGFKSLECDHEMRAIIKRRNYYKKQSDAYKIIIANLDKQILEYAGDENAVIDSIKVQKIHRKGSINYRELSEYLLKDAKDKLELIEKFRGEPIDYFSIKEFHETNRD